MFLKISIPLVWLFIFTIAADGQPATGGVRAGIVNGKALILPKPEYPPEARDFCAGGKVEVEVLIDEKGDVSEAKAISGDELLRDVSVKAVKKAKFSQNYDGFRGNLRGIIVYNFDSLAPKCITSGIVNKKALKLPVPQVGNIIHPRHLRLTKEEIVGVQVIVDMSGNITAARAVSGHPMLRPASLIAARSAKFSPTNINGLPVKVRALLVYKFKPDGSVETNIESDDKTVIGTPIILIEPLPPFCNCKIGGTAGVMVEAKTDEQGNVTEAKTFAGVSFLRNTCEKAALDSKFLPTNRKAKILLVYSFEMVGKYEIRIKNIEIKKVEIEK